MNAEAVTLDVGECIRFLQFWMQVTDTSHVTLVSIVPDGKTATRTFERGDLDGAKAWIAACQENSCNVYFQPNETPAGCVGKPSKASMVAALCRFADIDPLDEQFPKAEERDRLMRLAAYLTADPDFPPTAIIDSGNGIQPIWAVTREPLDGAVVARVEAETRAIEAALGAGGTHNVDRLLRLPGTVNYPNAAKRSKGRGVSRARLIFSAPNLYSIAQASELAEHLKALLEVSDLVRNGKRDRDDTAVATLIDKLRGAGAELVSKLEDLPGELVRRLQHAIEWHLRLGRRWAGDIEDLRQAGKDHSRSGADLSVAGLLKGAGFDHLETGLLLCAYPHGKSNNDNWPNPRSRFRHIARCVIRSHDTPGPDGCRQVAQLIAEFNDRYMVVSEQGKAIVYEPAQDLLLNRKHYIRITFPDLHRLHQNRLVTVGTDSNGNPHKEPAAKVWLNHENRRQFIGGVVFDPSGRQYRPDTLNLWQSFGVDPRPGSWALLRGHIESVICAGNHEYFDYLMGWIARLVQRPAHQGEVAVVMRGIEGTGKGIFARTLLRIVGQHGFAISNSLHLTGNFNGHLRDCIFLFADEAFYPGNPAHVGVLKSLITEPHLTIEAKYQNPVLAPNFVHLMMASNEDWVVPASLEARRFFVLDVLPTHANDHTYFGAIQAELENGGYEAMLHELLHHDINAFNVRRVPITAGLQTQKKLSLSTVDHWWLDVLYRGYVFRSRLGLEHFFGQWHEEMTTELLYESYTDYARQRRERHPLSREDFGKKMVSFGAQPTRPRNMVVGEHITDVPNEFGGSMRKATLIRHPRPPGYNVGSLEGARLAFVATTGLKVDWQGPGDHTDGTEEFESSLSSGAPTPEPKWRLRL